MPRLPRYTEDPGADSSAQDYINDHGDGTCKECKELTYGSSAVETPEHKAMNHTAMPSSQPRKDGDA